METYGKRTALYCSKCGKKIFAPANAIVGGTKCFACQNRMDTHKDLFRTRPIRYRGPDTSRREAH